MNYTVVKSIAVAAVLFTFASCSDDDDFTSETQTAYNNLPEASRSLIETNFSNVAVKKVIKKNASESDGSIYEVHLDNNYEIEFNEQGGMTDISGNDQQIPNGVVPAAILKYVQDNYPSNVYIKEIDTERFGYEIELSNHVDLYFDLNGNFISQDQDADNDDDNDEATIAYADLPQNVRTLIETHFPGNQAIYVSKNTGSNKDKAVYEVKLNNRFELDFDVDGNWTDIEGNQRQVPDALIPQAILSYVQANYPSPLFIEGIDKESFGYQVEISNDTDLKFNADGNFIGIDD
jgi:hypothetical protein